MSKEVANIDRVSSEDNQLVDEESIPHQKVSEIE
jgi:hypothetical protein